MSYTIQYSKEADRYIKKHLRSNKAALNKLRQLIHELEDHPRTGLGHPEPLVGGRDDLYSRHIDAHNRIVYQIFDDAVLVLVVKLVGHYDDK